MPSIEYLDYNERYFCECLELFDENCPRYFLENEKEDYIDFLNKSRSGYFVGSMGSLVVSAFGVTSELTSSRGRLSWILVSKKFQGNGIGTEMMDFVKKTAIEKKLTSIDIAASHLSALFFKKFGAIELNKIPNGWGENMHRIDMEMNL